MRFLKEYVDGHRPEPFESKPEYMYGVVCDHGIWQDLFFEEGAARKCADQIGGGEVVIVVSRVVVDSEGEYLTLPHRTKEMALAEAEKDVDESRKVFEAAMARATALK